MKHNFKDIDPNLCTFCGTCVGICPKSALTVKDEKIYQTEECNSCGLCYDACPGRELNFSYLNNFVFGDQDVDRDFGYYKSILAAYSKDEEIRSNASSGGVVTSLLVYLLESKKIDGAVVVGTDPKKPWCYDIKIAKTKEEILNASQSKYTLVPLNKILKEISQVEGNFALVGLPCHIHGIRKLQALNWKHAKKIKYLIGLFCGFNMHFSATKFLIQKLNVEEKEIINLQYRGGKYPGGFLVKTKNHEKSLGKFFYSILNPMYVPDRCLLCPDLTNELADISVGDIWSKKLENGWSSVIIRNNEAEELFRDVINNEILGFEQISRQELSKSHSHLINYKKKGIFLRLNLKKVKPIYDLDIHPMNIDKVNLCGFFFISAITIWKSNFARATVKVLPLKWIESMAYLTNRVMLKGGKK